MTDPLDTSTWPWYPLAAVTPVPPDFILCDQYYGSVGTSLHTLDLSDCVQAAGRLPLGNEIIRYHGPMPIEIQWGHCQVIVQAANIDSRTSYWSLRPSAFRDTAGWIIEQCVAQQLTGGFGTVQFQNVVNWVTSPSTTFENISQGPWPYDATFFTVTIMPDIRFERPGYEDPAIGEALSDAMQKAGRNAPANSDMAEHYSEGASRLFQQAQRMTPRGSSHRAWYKIDTDPRGPDNPMTYTCNADLGSPNPVDCGMLEYTQLGPPTDTITVGPGVSKFLSSKTCNLVVTASIAVVITWAQIRAALESLINICVSHPLSSARGGRAYATFSPPVHGLGGRDSERRNTNITGYNALTPHVNLTLFEHME